MDKIIILPDFSSINPKKTASRLDKLLKVNKKRIEKLLDSNTVYTWDNLILPLEEIDDKIGSLYNPLAHLAEVVTNDKLRAAHKIAQTKITEFYADLGQNKRLYEAYKRVAAESREFLNDARKKVLSDALRDFRLSGIELAAEQKKRFKTIAKKLSKLQTKFANNVMDDTDDWKKLVADEKKLAGLPERAKSAARRAAEKKGLDGWLFNLHQPTWSAVMTCADDRKLREETYKAGVTIASDKSLNAKKFDNSEIMEEILALRQEKARLLGFANYAELSVATKMAESTGEVAAFLKKLAGRSKPAAKLEIRELENFAKTEFGAKNLMPWDVAYFAEKLYKKKHDISQEELREYFPADKVVSGLFAIIQKLFGIRARERKNAGVWHPGVKAFEFREKDGSTRGLVYLDLYARPKKQSGAWANAISPRRAVGGKIRVPVAYVICNFTPPDGKNSALLTHREVETLFHEFGHALNIILTTVDYPQIGGLNGVEWDAVELPSQLLENWCWEKEPIKMISGHYKTGKQIPEKLYRRLVAAKNFNSASQLNKQMVLSLFDFELHLKNRSKTGERALKVYRKTHSRYAAQKAPRISRFPNFFEHIFSGGYAAGYYSYIWAEVLSADAFAKFKRNGVFDRRTAGEFKRNILETGGSRRAMENFVAFRGRKPDITALLKQKGLPV